MLKSYLEFKLRNTLTKFSLVSKVIIETFMLGNYIAKFLAFERVIDEHFLR